MVAPEDCLRELRAVKTEVVEMVAESRVVAARWVGTDGGGGSAWGMCSSVVAPKHARILVTRVPTTPRRVTQMRGHRRVSFQRRARPP